MKITVETGDITASTADAIVVNLFEGITAPGGATGAVETEVPGHEPVERLRLGAHDSFERGVAGLVDPGGHAHDRGQPGLHEIVSGLGLALHLESRAVNLDRLREGDSGDIKELRDHLRDDAGVPVCRLRGRDDEVEALVLDRLGENAR